MNTVDPSGANFDLELTAVPFNVGQVGVAVGQ
jgi:hypothetical protein